MEMKMKRALVQCTLTMMVSCDVQNTEGDCERIQSFVRQCVFGYHDSLKEDLYPVEQMADEVNAILNPLWDFYFNNLHDGYNVTVR